QDSTNALHLLLRDPDGANEGSAMPYSYDVRTTDLNSLGRYRALKPKEQAKMKTLKDEEEELHFKHGKIIREHMDDYQRELRAFRERKELEVGKETDEEQARLEKDL
ncbi:MAG: hypothetical protein Q9226_000993, partial [Calogaya cf. arnoldii]